MTRFVNTITVEMDFASGAVADEETNLKRHIEGKCSSNRPGLWLGHALIGKCGKNGFGARREG